MKRFCFLVSGGGGPLRFFYYASKMLNLPFEIVKVIADRECGAINFAKAKGIVSEQVCYNRNNSSQLIASIRATSCDYIITNFNKILGGDVLQSTTAKFINVHPSLLPAYAGMIGMKTVDSARKDGARFLGATTHDVIEQVDAGHIIQQVAFCSDWSVPITRMYDNTFRSVCLALLNTFLLETSTSKDIEGKGEFYFNPRVRFDIHLFDESFWSVIKTGE